MHKKTMFNMYVISLIAIIALVLGFVALKGLLVLNIFFVLAIVIGLLHIKRKTIYKNK